jgi:hypothetical protein
MLWWAGLWVIGGQMRRLLIGNLLVASWLFSVAAVAQEGFPLDGTWRGEHAAAKGAPTTVVVIMQWDGKQVAGTINPGPNGIEFTGATLDPDGWKVHLAAKDAKGKEVILEGVVSDLGKYSRVITGKWTEGGKTRDIRFVRE